MDILVKKGKQGKEIEPIQKYYNNKTLSVFRNAKKSPLAAGEKGGKKG